MADRVFKVTEDRYKFVQSGERGSQGQRGLTGDVTPEALAAKEAAEAARDQAVATYVNVPYKSFIKDCGAVPDGMTDNKPAIALAKQFSDEGYIISAEYEGAGVYFVGVEGTGDYVNRAKVEGLNLIMDSRAKFKMRAHPDFSRLNNLISPVRVENPYGREFVWGSKPALNEIAAVLGNPTVHDAPVQNINILSFTTDFQTIRLNQDRTFDDSTFTGTRTADKVTWSSNSGTAVKEGIQKSIKLGDYIELTAKKSATAALGNVFTTACGVRTKDGYGYIFYINHNARTLDFYSATSFKYQGRSLNPSGKMGDYYGLKDVLSDPSVTYAIRLVNDNTVEFYINGVLFAKETIFATHVVDRCFFTVELLYGASFSLLNPMSILKYNPHSSRPLNVALVGDSITHGSRSNFDYGELLSIITHGMNGPGRVSATNYGWSGSTAHGWATGYNGVTPVISYNFGEFDYVLVMLGTNEIVVLKDFQYFESDIKTIGDKITADGSTPIFGLIPPSLRPGAGVDLEYSNDWYSCSGELQSKLKKVCSQNGWKLAEPRNYIGANWDYLGDNLHPRDLGLALIAKSYAVAIAQMEKPRYINFDLIDYTADLAVATNITTTGATLTVPNSKGFKDYKYLQVIVSDGTNKHAEVMKTIMLNNGDTYKFDLSIAGADRYARINFVSNTTYVVTGLVGSVTITEIRLFN